MHESLHILLDLVLPEGIKQYFQLTTHRSDEDNLHLYLEELNRTPDEYAGNKLESKGFYNELHGADHVR